MDNKQNRQFFWNVKDFLSKNNEVKPFVPKSNIKNTINKVVSATQPVPVPVKEIVNSSQDTKNSVTRFLSAFGSAKAKQLPSDPTRAKNITANPFSLQESLRNNSSYPNADRRVSRIDQPGGVLSRDSKDNFYYRSLIPPPGTDGERPLYLDNVGAFANPEGERPSLLPPTVAGVNYVQQNLGAGLNSAMSRTAIPGTKAPTSPTSSTPSGSSAPPMTPSPIGGTGDEFRTYMEPPDGMTGPDTSTSPTGTNDYVSGSNLDAGRDKARLRNPRRATSNEILYGHSVRAYK
jgi:hypothetical protein